MKMETFSAAETAPLVDALPAQTRLSMRVRPAHRAALGTALGLTLPERIGERRRAGAREALCLGPDEWVILAPAGEAGTLTAAAAGVYDTAPHACADISDRELSYRVSGPGAAEIVAMGCPRDLRAIAPGEATRTIFDGAATILWRDGPEDFRLDIWRSFAPHALALLETGRAELSSGL